MSHTRSGHLAHYTVVALYRGTGRHNLTLTTLYRLAGALGVSVAELVTDDERAGIGADEQMNFLVDENIR